MTKADRPQRGIQSLDAAGSLLVALSASAGPMALKDLAREAGMTPSKAHPYLVSFVRHGLIEQDPATGHYDLGEQALRLGLTAMRRLAPLTIAKNELLRLPTDGHFSFAIAVWANQGPTIVHFQEADYPLGVFIRSGTVLSLGYTAAGLVFSTYMPEETVRVALAGDRYRLSGRSDDLTLARLRRLTAEVRRSGVGRSLGSTVPGVNSISAPAFGHDGRLALTVSVMRPGTPADAGVDSEIAKIARAWAAKVSARLGHDP